jgi:hypothetical protein
MNEEPRDPRLIDADAPRVGRKRIVRHPATSLAAQWTGFFLAPATFFAHLQVAYVLVPWSCARDSHLWLHVAGALSVLLALVGTAVAWTVWAREGGGEPGQHGGPSPRARFLAVSGVVMSAMFALLLAGQWVAVFIISPCQ